MRTQLQAVCYGGRGPLPDGRCDDLVGTNDQAWPAGDRPQATEGRTTLNLG